LKVPAETRVSSEFKLVLASLFIAFIIWLIAKQGDVDQETLVVRVSPINEPKYCDVEIMTDEAAIVVQFPKAQKYQISPANFKILVDLSHIDIGIDSYKETTIPIAASDVQRSDLPDTIKVVDVVDPRRIIVSAKYHSEVASVLPATSGSPAPGYRLAKPVTTNPEQVLVTGDAGRLEELKQLGGGHIEIPTEPVVLDGMKENFLTQVKLLMPHGIRLIDERNSRLQANVVIEEERIQRDFADVPIDIKTFSKNLVARYQPKTTTVTVEAPLSFLDKINAESFVFNPKQPLEESAGYSANVAIEAKFSDTVSPEVKENATIIGTKPDVISIQFVEKGQSSPSVP
jgi:YbbR domain-containing protein